MQADLQQLSEIDAKKEELICSSFFASIQSKKYSSGQFNVLLQ